LITSLTNDKVKLARALARRRTRWQERAFIVEGVRLLDEIARQRVPAYFVFYTEAAAASPDVSAVLDRLSQQGAAAFQVSEEVMAACSDTVTPSGLLAVVPFPDIPAPVQVAWVLVVDSVRTPGNLGAILRTAAAAGVDQVFLPPGTVDLYNPKVVRGGAGVHFRLPILALTWEEIVRRLAGFRTWLAAPRADVTYTQVDWKGRVALLMGGEAEGASTMGLDLAGGQVTIPMARDVESLNVAVAAGILLFEIARQRRA
jgi:TrmH family RNA methyltransferase